MIEALVRARKREIDQMEAALRKIYDLAEHAPVATRGEQVIADIQGVCKSAGAVHAKAAHG